MAVEEEVTLAAAPNRRARSIGRFEILGRGGTVSALERCVRQLRLLGAERERAPATFASRVQPRLEKLH